MADHDINRKTRQESFIFMLENYTVSKSYHFNSTWVIRWFLSFMWFEKRFRECPIEIFRFISGSFETENLFYWNTMSVRQKIFAWAAIQWARAISLLETFNRNYTGASEMTQKVFEGDVLFLIFIGRFLLDIRFMFKNWFVFVDNRYVQEFSWVLWFI